MITGAVGWIWALGVFALTFVGLILSIMLVKAGSTIEAKELEVDRHRGRMARTQVATQASSTVPNAQTPAGSTVAPGATAPAPPVRPPQVTSPETTAIPGQAPGHAPVHTPGQAPDHPASSS